MTIASGTRLGPYEVVAPVGAGGMGEVWRAKDTRLDREVAIKILPAAFADDAQFRVRFEREAKAISSLNHPHICTLHDVGQENGLHYLVMELIEGESLADRLKRGALPPEQVLRYGAQIAHALDAAHRRGVIHRDLKPGNIMITKSGAKLLDFGLAKGNAAAGVGGLSVLQTEQKPITEQGMILGTFQYMSPEQLEGVEVDARSDIFALGAVLYEMATGRRAFEGKSKTSLIAAIVSAQPAPITSVAPMTPPALDHVVRKCLEKDPDERWQSAHDVASELQWISEAGSQAGVAAATIASRRSRKMLLAALAITGWTAATAAIAWLMWDRSTTAPLRRPFRTDLAFPAETTLAFIQAGPIVLSPDGRRLAFVARGGASLVVYDFETARLQRLEGTAEALFPFWSPDGRWLGFFADGKLKKIEAGGGPVQVLCDAPDGRGGAWNGNGTILFAPDIAGPLMSVPEAGGTPVAATRVPKEDEWTHRNPHFLPGGEQFLLTVRQTNRDPVGSIAIGSVGRTEVKVLTTGSNPQYANGYLFFVRDRNLMAQRLDIRNRVLAGSPIPIASGIDYFNPRDLGNFSVSPAGVLVYRQAVSNPTQLAWIDRSGGVVSTIGDPGLYAFGRADAAARMAALLRRDEIGQESIWVMDLQRGTVTRSTENYSGGLMRAVPAPSGQQIAVSTQAGNAKRGLWIQTPSATGAQRALIDSGFAIDDWSRDGNVIIGGIQVPGTKFDIVWVAVDKPGKVHTFIASRFDEQFARLSPNGRWVAYRSNDGGTNETYISDFPERKNRWQVTRSGGQPVLWSGDGRELIVLSRDRLIAYPMTDKVDTIEIGTPVALPPLPDVVTLVGTRGDKLLVLRRVAEADDEPLRVIRNWQALVE